MRQLMRAATWVVALFAAAPASALVITFDFDAPVGNPSQASSMVFTDLASGVSLTVTALRRQGPNFLGDALVTRTQNGLGVSTPGQPNGQLDSVNVNEALVWTLSGPIAGLQLDRVLFGAWETGNDFQLYTDITANNDLFGAGLIPGPANQFNPPNPWLPAAMGLFPTASSNFAMKVTPAGGTEGFRVSEMTFTTIPEPASLTLLVVGAAGLAARRRGRA